MSTFQNIHEYNYPHSYDTHTTAYFRRNKPSLPINISRSWLDKLLRKVMMGHASYFPIQFIGTKYMFKVLCTARQRFSSGRYPRAWQIARRIYINLPLKPPKKFCDKKRDIESLVLRGDWYLDSSAVFDQRAKQPAQEDSQQSRQKFSFSESVICYFQHGEGGHFTVSRNSFYSNYDI